MTEEYELLPHQLLEDLKYDVEALKKKLNEPDNKTNELILEIESLKDSIHELTSIFQKVITELKEEDPSQLLKDVVKQNETIASGMVAISDKLEEFMHKHSKPVAPAPMPHPVVKHTMGVPPLPGGRIAPPPLGEELDLPPPPPGMARKRTGLFK